MDIAAAVRSAAQAESRQRDRLRSVLGELLQQSAETDVAYLITIRRLLLMRGYDPSEAALLEILTEDFGAVPDRPWLESGRRPRVLRGVRVRAVRARRHDKAQAAEWNEQLEGEGLPSEVEPTPMAEMVSLDYARTWYRGRRIAEAIEGLHLRRQIYGSYYDRARDHFWATEETGWKTPLDRRVWGLHTFNGLTDQQIADRVQLNRWAVLRIIAAHRAKAGLLRR